jgi:hypothetical protein
MEKLLPTKTLSILWEIVAWPSWKYLFVLPFGLIDNLQIIYPYLSDERKNAIMPTLSYIQGWPWLIISLVYLIILITWSSYNAVKKANERVNEYISQSPSIELSELRGSPLFINEKPIYFIWQAWFQNKPKIRNEQSIAKDVTALIEFWEIPDRKLYRTVFGQWAETNAPVNITHNPSDGKLKTDMQPNNEYHKLSIVIKYPEENECYAYARENFTSDPTFHNPTFVLSNSQYLVRIRLEGLSVEEEFELKLVNPGKGHNPKLTRII